HRLGAKAYVVDARREFAEQYVLPALAANAMYEGQYPLSTALARPLIGKHLVAVAQREGASFIAHGCTGKGNDQVRFDLCTTALAPDRTVIAPAREWGMTREEEIAYAKERGIPVPVDDGSPYSTDENLWGRSIECGVLEDPRIEPPEEVYAWTTSPAAAPDEPGNVTIHFESGKPTSLQGKPMDFVDLIATLSELAGRHGVGRIDHVESRVVGIKSREVYECPAATVLVKAHQALEALVLPRDVLEFQRIVASKYAGLVYDGLWFTPLREALDAFVASTQDRVTGDVSIKLFKGTATVVGRASPFSLYDHALVEMLAAVGILSKGEAELLGKGLRGVYEEIASGRFVWREDLEDVHTNIEVALTERLGSLGAKLHTARSRNDQIALDERLFV